MRISGGKVGMITLKINGLDVSVEEGSTLLEAARFLGFPIPTLCYMDGLSPYGACRLCVVEIGEGSKAKLVSSCTYPAEEGLAVRTASERVLRARRMVLELLLASCPQSKTIQKSDVCRLCGGCMYVCPACQLRCTYNEPEKAICGGCANLTPPCLEKEQFNDMMCYMSPCVACEIKTD